MLFEWDEHKRDINLQKHGVDFIAACELWESAMVVIQDERINYGEKRWIGLGKLGKRVMVVVFTKRDGNCIRIISFRKANKREESYYEKERLKTC